MDVKSAFLNDFINEDVYVVQPPGFIDFEKSDPVYKFKKDLYGLKQAHKAWYDRLKAFLIKHYKMGMIDNTLFTKKKSSNLIIVQIYIDDVIFGSTCQDICDEFSKIMHDEFEMSMMGELNFFLRLQIKQMEDVLGIIDFYNLVLPFQLNAAGVDYQYKDAKTLFEAIQARFGGNDATKKKQRTLLKQMYKNFNTPSTESLDSIFNRLQKIISQLAILDLDTMSIDDLYNNFKIVEQEVKRTVASSSSSGSPNMAFLSSPGSTNEVDTASIQVSVVSTPVSNVSSHDNTANLSNATVYAFLENQPNGSQLVHKDLEQIHEDDLEEMDLNSRKTMNVEDTSSKAMVAIDEASFDWSYMVDDEVPTNMALMAFSDPENEVVFCDQIVILKRDASFRDSEITALNLQIEKLKKEKESNQIKIDNFENASKSLDKLIESQMTDNSRTGLGFTSYNAIAPPPTGLFAPPSIDFSNSGLEYDEDESEEMVLKSDNVQHKPKQANQPRKVSKNPKGNRTNWNEMSTQKLGMVQKPVLKNVEKGMVQREVRPVWNNAMRTNHQNLSNSRRNVAPTAVLTKSGIVPISTARQSSSRVAAPVSAARPINTAASKPLVNVAKPR
nr:copia protein [Tanacetum cinerariifolium]